MHIKFKKLSEDAQIFKKQHNTDACFDMYASEGVIVEPNSISLVPTGIAMEIPFGYEGQVRPRSGLSAKGMLVVLGTIDSGYRGEIKVIIHNINDKPYIINPGDRIAQFTISKVTEGFFFDEVPELSDSDREDNGFGSTGGF